MRNLRTGIVALFFCIVAIGCEHALPIEAVEENGLEPLLSSIQERIFDRKCAIPTCHQGPSPPRNLNLSAGESWSFLVNVPAEGVPTLDRVEPGDPDNSYLVWKLEGNPPWAIVGQQMPRGGQELSSKEIAAIRQWITDGAEDN